MALRIVVHACFNSPTTAGSSKIPQGTWQWLKVTIGSVGSNNNTADAAKKIPAEDVCWPRPKAGETVEKDLARLTKAPRVAQFLRGFSARNIYVNQRKHQ